MKQKEGVITSAARDLLFALPLSLSPARGVAAQDTIPKASVRDSAEAHVLERRRGLSVHFGHAATGERAQSRERGGRRHPVLLSRLRGEPGVFWWMILDAKGDI